MIYMLICKCVNKILLIKLCENKSFVMKTFRNVCQIPKGKFISEPFVVNCDVVFFWTMNQVIGNTFRIELI